MATAVRGRTRPPTDGFAQQSAPVTVQQDTLPEQISQAGTVGPLAQVLKHPLLNGVYLQNLSFTNGVNVMVPHKLGRRPIAVLPCLATGASPVALTWVRSTQVSPYDETKFLSINPSATTTASLYVF